MSIERSGGYRLHNDLIIRGLRFLQLASDAREKHDLVAALTYLWEARGAFNESHSLEAGAFRVRAQKLIDEVQKEQRDALQKDV